jgi:glycosyltransferase involved in cell wall biosynthesis
VAELIELGRRTQGRLDVRLIGPADDEVEESLRSAHEAGHVSWLGPMPNPGALARVDGALAGLSLLHDEPNYRHSQPTKIVEYLAHGVPAISTPLPLASELIHTSGGGIVVPHGDVDAVVAAVDRLRDPSVRQPMVDSGRAHVAENYDWERDGAVFVEQLERWAGAGR